MMWHSGSPHVRGDGPIPGRRVAAGSGFSPRAWGWSDLVVLVRAVRDVLPTCVGMVRSIGLAMPATGGSPHVRGDGPPDALMIPETMKFSPGRFAGSSLVFGFCSAWNEELRAVFPARERGDTMGVARTAAVLRKPPLPGRSCRPLRGLRSRGCQEGMPGGAIRCGPGAGAARLRSAAPFGAQSQKNQRDRSTQNLGLTPPGYDLPPRSGLRKRQEGMPGGAIRSGPGAGAARLRSAAPLGAQSQKNQRDRSAQNLGLTPPGYDLPPRSGLGTRQEGVPGGAIRSGPGAGAARLRSAAPAGAQSQKNQRDRSTQNLAASRCQTWRLRGVRLDFLFLKAERDLRTGNGVRCQLAAGSCIQCAVWTVDGIASRHFQNRNSLAVSDRTGNTDLTFRFRFDGLGGSPQD